MIYKTHWNIKYMRYYIFLVIKEFLMPALLTGLNNPSWEQDVVARRPGCPFFIHTLLTVFPLSSQVIFSEDLLLFTKSTLNKWTTGKLHTCSSSNNNNNLLFKFKCNAYLNTANWNTNSNMIKDKVIIRIFKILSLGVHGLKSC